VTGETAIALLGPQQVKPTVGQVLRDLCVRGPVALVTAGWQEREGEDEAIAGPVCDLPNRAGDFSSAPAISS
jgi:hypothetical protein